MTFCLPKLPCLLFATLVLGGLGACATKPASQITLLPDASGRVTSVSVTTSKGSQVLNRPYQVATVDRKQNLQLGETDAATVNKSHPQLIELMPADVQRFVLYFQPGSSNLTPESLALLPQVMASARQRSGGEIIVIGHTDRQGAADANDRLSLQRASAVRALFVTQGFDPSLVEASGRGEREPLVPTEDEVVEPRNRRAEVLVR
jgi:outer membrane protein OmpA-like peptidoglycan-associated protein